MNSQQQSSEMQEFNVLFPSGHEIELNGYKFILKPFTLKQLRVVTDTCNGLVSKFAKLYMDARQSDDDADMKFVEGLPALVIEFIDDVTFLIAESLRAPKEYVEDNLTGVVASRMLQGIMEINDIDEMIKNFQNALGTIFREPPPAGETAEETEASAEGPADPATETAV